jgi:hypothetical protein
MWKNVMRKRILSKSESRRRWIESGKFDSKMSKFLSNLGIHRFWQIPVFQEMSYEYCIKKPYHMEGEN